jgi:hypothetical protein
MSIYLLAIGLIVSLGFWLMGLRPHISRKGKQMSGINFMQAMLSDLEQGRVMAKCGDNRARVFCRIIWFFLLLSLVSFVAMVW